MINICLYVYYHRSDQGIRLDRIANRYYLQKLTVNKDRLWPDQGRLSVIRNINGRENVSSVLDLTLRLFGLPVYFLCTKQTRGSPGIGPLINLLDYYVS